MEIIKIFYDLETTGTNPYKHSIHQIVGIIEIGGVVYQKFNIKTRPHPKAQIDEKALRIAGVTLEQVRAYQPMAEAFKNLMQILSFYIDPSDKQTRAYLVGFNNASFDDEFLRAWFRQNGSEAFPAYFWFGSFDVAVFASHYLADKRPFMPSFKLHRVAKTLGVQVDKSRLHEAGYDVELTRKIYQIVCR